MGFDIAGVIVQEFALLAHAIEVSKKAKASGKSLTAKEAENLSKIGCVSLPDEYFNEMDLDRLRNSIDYNRLDDVWDVTTEAIKRLTGALKNPENTAAIDAEIDAASRTICAQLSGLRVATGGPLNHPVLEKLWLTFGCDSYR
jgi:hypothetical protein